MDSDFRLATVVSVHQETPTVRTITLRPEQPLSFVPGQFVMLHFPGDGAVKRSYSLSSATGSDTFQLTFNIVPGGAFSPRLYALQPGAQIEYSGPFGNFQFSAAGDPLVFIGGGTGIAPLRSMIKHALHTGQGSELILLYSARTEEEIIYRNELEQLANEHFKFRPVITLTKPDKPWPVTGRINEDLVREHVPGPQAAQFFLCGSPEFVRDIRGMLMALGVPDSRVRNEQW